MDQNVLYLDAAHKLAAIASELGHSGAPVGQVHAILDCVFSLSELADRETEKIIARLGYRNEHKEDRDVRVINNP